MADTILSALNKLVEKNGGDTEDNKLIVDAINDLVESSGGSSGGSSLPVITFTTTDEETEETTCDKTVEQIAEEFGVELPSYRTYPVMVKLAFAGEEGFSKLIGDLQFKTISDGSNTSNAVEVVSTFVAPVLGRTSNYFSMSSTLWQIKEDGTVTKTELSTSIVVN